VRTKLGKFETSDPLAESDSLDITDMYIRFGLHSSCPYVSNIVLKTGSTLQTTSYRFLSNNEQGKSTILPLVLMIIAQVLFNLAAFDCKTFKVEIEDLYAFEDNNDNDFWDSDSDWDSWYNDYDSSYSYQSVSSSSSISFGYWGVHEDFLTDSCFSFKKLGVKSELDAPLKVGRAMGVLGSIIGALSIIAVLAASCVIYPERVVVHGGSTVGVLMGALSATLFVGLASENCRDENDAFACGLGWPAYLAAASFVLWICAGCFLRHVTPRQDRMMPQDPKNEGTVVEATPMQASTTTTEVVETSLPDGTR